MARVIHFEIPANDPDALSAFYAKLFDWQIQKWPGPQEYWLARTGEGSPGIDGGFLKKRDPTQPTCNTIGVANLDDSIRMVEENGGKLVVPRMTIPGVGHLAYCNDPEGTCFGMLEGDIAAK